MPYGYLTFAQFRSELANRLADPNKIFWVDAELKLYAREALRCWNSIANFFRDRGVFNATRGAAFYDLPSLAKDGAGALLRGYTLKDSDLVTEIQYHMLEPATGNSWTGTEMFSLADVTAALERRRNQFLIETGAVVGYIPTIAVPSPTIGRVPVPDTIIDLRRVGWRNADNTNYASLWREDEFSAQAFAPSWNLTPNTPAIYSTTSTPQLTIQLIPPPIDTGALDLIAIQAPAALNPAVGVLLNIPDDFAWAIKYGAMADLLGRESEAKDPDRAAYCDQRWQMGVQAAAIAVSVMRAYVNDSAVQVDALENLDAFLPGWQIGMFNPAKQSAPTIAAMAGLNLVALSPVPDDTYGVTVDVVRNAVVPVADGDFIQLGREELDVVIDYAQHVASFKQAGEEFKATQQGFQRFVGGAAGYNQKLTTTAIYADVMKGQAGAEKVVRPIA